MTRDEAMAAMIESKKKWGGGSSEAWLLNSLEAVGLLKIDEPKSADDRFYEAMTKYGFYKSVGEQVLGALQAAGLKIVER